MAASKSYTTLLASTANTTGSTTNGSATANISTQDYAKISISMINGTGTFSAPCNAIIYVSYDNSTFWAEATLPAGLTASATYSPSYSLDSGVAYVKITFTGNTGGTTTCAAVCGYGTW